MSVPRDIQDFLDGYPGQTDDDSARDNLLFYTNKLRCRPDGLLIEELLDRWHGEYGLLERKHGFIQWLFPIREHGMNYESQPLEVGELAQMKQDATVKSRLIRAYRLMLDFYGLLLVDEVTGRLERTQTFQPRFRNLQQSSHNYLRISRILKCLGEFGLHLYPAAFVLYVLSEQAEHNNLANDALKSSMDRWWANANRNNVERQQVLEAIRKVRKGGIFTTADYKAFLDNRQSQNQPDTLSEDPIGNAEIAEPQPSMGDTKAANGESKAEQNNKSTTMDVDAAASPSKDPSEKKEDNQSKDKDADEPVTVPSKRSAEDTKDGGDDASKAPATNGHANGHHKEDDKSNAEDGQPEKKKQKVEADFENTEKDKALTGGDQPATQAQKAFVSTLAEKAGDGKVDETELNKMTRNEASDKIDTLKAEADKKEPSALEVDKTPEEGSHLAQPDKWATGAEPATDKQGRYLAVLEKKAGETVDAGKGLTKSEASEKIQDLKEKTGA